MACSIEGCGKPATRRGWCNTHYKRWNRHGDPLYTYLPAWDRFWLKVTQTDTCWLWTAGRTHNGYGIFWPTKTKGQVAHKWLWERNNGPVPTGLQLDHLCRVRRCVNPGHLEPVTPAENLRRAAQAS